MTNKQEFFGSFVQKRTSFLPSCLPPALAACLLLATPAPAASLRVGANDPHARFRTIGACVTQARHGDRCIVASGVYPETVTPHSGITIQAAPGATIDGTDPLTGWTSLGGNLWSVPYTKPAGIPAIQIFIDRVPGNEARWPNAAPNPIRPNWSTMQAGTTPTLIVDPNLPAGDWTGAIVHMFSGSDPYSHKTAYVTASAPGQLTLNDPAQADCPTYCAAPGGLYYLFGPSLAADTPGEWYLRHGTLYLLLPAGLDPNRGHVRAKARLLGVDLTHSSNTTVTGLTLFAASIATGPTTQSDTIDSITARYISELDILDSPKRPEPIGAYVANSGIVLRGQGHTLQNSIIDTSAGNGVTIDGREITVQNNLIRATGYLGSYVAPVEIIAGAGAQVLHNTIAGASGYGITGGLDPRSLNAAHIAYNNVHDTMLQRVDGAPIYFCCSGTPTLGMSIDHNWVHDYKVPLPPYWGAGIYLDNGLGQSVPIWQNFVTRPNTIEPGISLNGQPTGKTGRHAKVQFNTVQGQIPYAITYDNQVLLTVTDNKIAGHGNGLGDYGGNSFTRGSPARNNPRAAGATDLMPDPNKAGVGCDFQGCSSPPP